MLLSEVPLMWKPASQLQCWARFTWAQRGLRLNAGSFITLHSGGAASKERSWKFKTCATWRFNAWKIQSVIPSPSPVSFIYSAALTCLGLVLAVRAAPVLGTGAFVLVSSFHTGSSILTGITRTLTYICQRRRERFLLLTSAWTYFFKNVKECPSELHMFIFPG